MNTTEIPSELPPPTNVSKTQRIDINLYSFFSYSIRFYSTYAQIITMLLDSYERDYRQQRHDDNKKKV
jgi:hypothetical protein